MKPLCSFLLLISAVLCEDFAGRSRQLAVSLYNGLSKNNDNNFLAGPIFLDTLLALSETGAAGATAEEIRTVFNFPGTNQELEEEVKSLLSALQSISAVQNRISYNENYTLKAAFAKTAESIYQATLQESTTEAVDLTNNFVFRSNWNPQFVSSPIPNFYIDAETSIEVEGVLQRSTSYNYAEDADLDVKFLELPFEAEGVSMILILPNQRQGLEALEENIAKVFALPQFEKQFVQVTLPKFKVAATLELSSFFKELGLKTAFGNNADFSGIAGDPGDIHLGKITQKAVIQLDDAGVNVPITTNVEDEKQVIRFRPPMEAFPFLAPPPTRNFTADHPFIFYIQANGVVLVEGKIVRPDKNV